MVEEKFIKICPRCGSDNFYYKSSKYGAMFPTCRNCGYTDNFIEVTKEVQKEIQDKYTTDEPKPKPRFEGTSPLPSVSGKIQSPTFTKIMIIASIIAIIIILLVLTNIL